MLEKNSTLANAHSESGQIVESFLPLEPQKELECMTLTSTCEVSININTLELPKSPSAIVECQATVKKKTLKDKLTQCAPSTLITESSPILLQESISEGKVLKPFWNSRCQEMSNKLWCPTEIDSVGLPLNCLNGCFHTTESNSWFLTQTWNPQKMENSQKTSLPSLTFLTAESTGKESTKKAPKKKLIAGKKTNKKKQANTCRKVRLQPSPENYNKIKRWFGSVRKTYNWTLESVLKKNLPINMFWLRNRFVNECNIPSHLRFLLETPKHVREGAIEDLVKGFKLNFQKGERFEMKFRKRKENQSIVIPKDAIKSIKEGEGMKLYPTFLKNVIKMNTRRCSEVDFDCRLTMDKLGRLYLYVPRHVEVHDNQMDKKHSWASLDPGVRTFMTSYSPSTGVAMKYATGDNLRLYRLCRYLDKLVSKTSSLKGQKKRRCQKAEQRLRYRVKHLVDDVHWKVANHLVSNFQNIIIPPFEVQQMVKRGSRVLSRKSVRSLYNWSHYRFRQRLLDRAKKQGVNVFVLSEEYTTKTCTICGHRNNVQCAKVIKCSDCHVKYDRDLGGARNIFIKNAKIVPLS